MFQCPIYRFLGIPCPTCGMTRAFLCLLNGDIGGAFSMNPLIFSLPIFLAFLLCGKTRKRAFFIMITLFFAVYAVRMIMFFPHTPPMIFNDKSILAAVIDIIGR